MKDNESDDKKMATACFTEIQLDLDRWRVGNYYAVY